MSRTEYVPSSKLEVKTAAINYPSARLGATTRKSNEIANLPKERTAENIKLVTTLFDQLHEKIINFKDACMEELSKEVSDADKHDFSQWMERHMKKALDYAEVVQRWLQGLEADDDIAPEDSASQAVAQIVLNHPLKERN